MIKPMKLFWILALGQLCVVLALLIRHFYVVASDIVAQPTHVDAYFVYTWSFRIMVFCIFWLLPTLIGMGVLIALEWFILRFFSAKRKAVPAA